MTVPLRLSLQVAGDAVTCTLGDATLSRRHEIAFDRERAHGLARAVVATLQRATHERALAERNLADLRHAGEQLYLALLPAEVREALRARKGPLLLELDEVLVTVPWELLYDGQHFLCRRYDVGRSVATPQPLRGQPARSVARPLRMLVLAADPSGALPAVAAEGEALCAAMDRQGGVRAVLLADADPATVRRHLKEYDAVHFAGHAHHDPDRPGRSGWRLRDGDLTADDVVALAGGSPLPLMVFANGCRSTQTDAWVGDDPTRVYGLANAFLLAGVRYYLGTQWDVTDGRGREFAVHFWGGIAAGLAVGAALRQARDAVAATFGEAELGWAPYVLYGDPSYVPLGAAVAPPVADPRELFPRPGSLARRPSAPYKRVSPDTVRPPPRPSWRTLTVALVAGAATLALLASGLFTLRLWRSRAGAPRVEPHTLALLGVGTGTSLEGGAEAHAAALESCLLASLARRGHHRLVDRARISALKRERGAELARLGTTGAAEAGRELRADYVVYGEVAVVSGKPFFSIFCANPATHQVVFGDNLDGLDAKGCDALGGRLLDRLDEIGRAGRSE
ncbi:MAG: CHAT domain-containing protein [Deltaproteobacteria bacterium]|nr:CHAT domain-containing protein [Deltaproteobacteria bacterium]